MKIRFLKHLKLSISLISAVLFFSIFSSLCGNVNESEVIEKSSKSVVEEALEIKFEEFPDAFNPSIIAVEEGFLLTFRYLPDPLQAWIANMGIVLLDQNLKPITKPQLLNTRDSGSPVPPQGEDARIFAFDGDIYLIYNDNPYEENPPRYRRRDMYIARLYKDNDEYKLEEPLKIYHQQRYFEETWQKNWSPFEWNNQLFFIYTPTPHEIISTDMMTGACNAIHVTEPEVRWKWGKLRGGTPAVLIDGEYVTFFHSATMKTSAVSGGTQLYHYFMGAYAFSGEPPFAITKMTEYPLGASLYSESDYAKRVIFPGGVVVTDNHIYVAYGKDDREMWIAKINKRRLLRAMVPIESQ